MILYHLRQKKGTGFFAESGLEKFICRNKNSKNTVASFTGISYYAILSLKPSPAMIVCPSGEKRRI